MFTTSPSLTLMKKKIHENCQSFKGLACFLKLLLSWFNSWKQVGKLSFQLCQVAFACSSLAHIGNWLCCTSPGDQGQSYVVSRGGHGDFFFLCQFHTWMQYSSTPCLPISYLSKLLI